MIIPLLVLGNFFIFSYSQIQLEESGFHSFYQVKEEIVFELPKNKIVVILSENKYDQNISLKTYLILYVNCQVQCSGRWIPKHREKWKGSAMIFQESTYEWPFKPPNERTVDSLFQNLYNWIKEIDDFENNCRIGDTITMKYHYIHNSTLNGDSYFLKAKSCNISISTDTFLRDQEGYLCFRQTKMKSKTITEFKKRLLEYIRDHKVNIRL